MSNTNNKNKPKICLNCGVPLTANDKDIDKKVCNNCLPDFKDDCYECNCRYTCTLHCMT